MIQGRLSLPAAATDVLHIAIGVELRGNHPSDSYPHSAILYRDEAKDELWVLEFYLNGKIEASQAPERIATFAWAVPVLTKDESRVLANFCHTIKTRRPRFRYGFRFLEDSRLVEKGAEIVLEGTSVGLTCATFVLVVFKNQAINLLDLDSWEVRPEDKKWQTKWLGRIQSRPLIGNHNQQSVAQLADEVESDCARYKPQEVFAAAIIGRESVRFEEAVPVGDSVWLDLSNLWTARAERGLTPP